MGYDCLCMDSANKLIALIGDIEPSLILMDIEMPGITGLEAAGILKKQQEGKPAKHVVIALTAHNDINILDTVVAAGFDDYLQKPITRRDLKTRLSKYIRNDSEPVQVENSVKPEAEIKMDKLYSLEMFDADDPEFVRDIVEMFVVNTPVSIDAIKKAYEMNEMETLRQQAHKLKPHFSFFGASALQKTFQQIEDIAKSKTDTEQLPDLISGAEKVIVLMIDQMKEDLLPKT